MQTHRTLKKKKEKINEKTKKREKKNEKMKNGLTASLYIGFVPLTPAVSLWVEGRRQSRANHRPRAEAVGETCAGDARDVGARGHRRRDLVVAQ